MSLVTDEPLLLLWSRVQQKGSRENVAVNFWLHLYAKYVFAEKEWIIAVEDAPSELEPSKRGDLKVQYLGDAGFELLLHQELKRREATKRDLEEVEHQAFSDCISYLAAHEEVSMAYAVTSFGTRARMWTCAREATYLEPLFGSEELAEPSQYIEAHSSEATELRKGYDHMKRFSPVARRGIEPGERSPKSSRSK
ncbi:uncharacterized protein PV07_12652 [Cladophialophora immunda]|uniref:Uncharacterized protein n=1 Tax=Cladophialophora immunda TaxID=569365 RepID=A0A0D2BU48_9EURO|nr:uncharacterized protein PV07_12652 [Cladophialophora immunda]KIW21940.1 hypothetical protein PV07_12652 [Cladophialophora immunda]